MTSGGSESIVSALLASVTYAKTTRGIKAPEIVVADSAHAAVYKAARMCSAEYVPGPCPSRTAIAFSAYARTLARRAGLW